MKTQKKQYIVIYKIERINGYEKIFLKVVIVLCMFILSGCSNDRAGEIDMAKFTDGYCWISLLDENSYYRNGD